MAPRASATVHSGPRFPDLLIDESATGSDRPASGPVSVIGTFSTVVDDPTGTSEMVAMILGEELLEGIPLPLTRVLPGDQVRVQREAAQAWRAAATFRSTFRTRDTVGILRKVLVVAEPQRGATGDVVGYRGVVFDAAHDAPPSQRLSPITEPPVPTAVPVERRRIPQSHRFALTTMIAASEAERRDLAGQLHDDVVQPLLALCWTIDNLEHPAAAGLRADIDVAIAAVSKVAFQLIPPALAGDGIRGALQARASDLATTVGAPVDVELSGRRFDEGTEMLAYRCTRNILDVAATLAGLRGIRVVSNSFGDLLVVDVHVACDCSAEEVTGRLAAAASFAAVSDGELIVLRRPAGFSVKITIPPAPQVLPGG